MCKMKHSIRGDDEGESEKFNLLEPSHGGQKTDWKFSFYLKKRPLTRLRYKAHPPIAALRYTQSLKSVNVHQIQMVKKKTSSLRNENSSFPLSPI